MEKVYIGRNFQWWLKLSWPWKASEIMVWKYLVPIPPKQLMILWCQFNSFLFWVDMLRLETGSGPRLLCDVRGRGGLGCPTPIGWFPFQNACCAVDGNRIFARGKLEMRDMEWGSCLAHDLWLGPTSRFWLSTSSKDSIIGKGRLWLPFPALFSWFRAWGGRFYI